MSADRLRRCFGAWIVTLAVLFYALPGIAMVTWAGGLSRAETRGALAAARQRLDIFGFAAGCGPQSAGWRRKGATSGGATG